MRSKNEKPENKSPAQNGIHQHTEIKLLIRLKWK